MHIDDGDDRPFHVLNRPQSKRQSMQRGKQISLTKCVAIEGNQKPGHVHSITYKRLDALQ